MADTSIVDIWARLVPSDFFEMKPPNKCKGQGHLDLQMTDKTSRTS